jgi:hypothetical protein
MHDTPLFRDPSLNQTFHKKGFVQAGLLNVVEVSELRKAYDSLPRPKDDGFHCTMFSPSEDLRKSVDRIIKESLVEKLSRIFLDQKPLYGNFMVKEPGIESDWFVHQDWAYVDENEHYSVAVWVPLTDLTLDNGVICMVPGSHQIKNPVRGPGVTDPYEDVHEEIKKKYHEKVFLKAGEAVIWHHRLVHFSPPNLSNTARVAATLIYTPADVPVIHFWKDPNAKDSMADTYSVDTDFFMDYVISKAPNGVKKANPVNSSFPAINASQLKMFFKPKSGANFKLLKMLKNLLNL